VHWVQVHGVRYSYLAKERRYKKMPLLPEKIDFIQQSNSQTVRMYFNVRELPVFEERAHLLSITIDPRFVTDLETDGFLFGVKLSFNKKRCGGSQCFELFQSIDKGSKGCLTEEGEWVPHNVFYRETVVFKKLKWFKNAGIIPDATIIFDQVLNRDSWPLALPVNSLLSARKRVHFASCPRCSTRYKSTTTHFNESSGDTS
jgi:hypothetical protein